MNLNRYFPKWLNQVLAGMFLISIFCAFVFNIRSELTSANNKGLVRISAIYSAQQIENILINGKNISSSQIVSNEWTTHNIDVVNTHYTSSPLSEEVSMVIQSAEPVKTVSFEYRNADDDSFLHIQVDNQLIEKVNTKHAKNGRSFKTVQLDQYYQINSTNILWYVQALIFLISIAYVTYFQLFYHYSKIRLLFFALLLWGIQYVIKQAFGFFYEDKVTVFNSSYTENQLTLTLWLFAFLALIAFKVIADGGRPLIKRVHQTSYYSLLLATPFLAFFIIENCYSQFNNIEAEWFVPNLIILYAIYFVFAYILGLKAASFFLLLLSLSSGFANEILIKTRETPFMHYHLLQFFDGLNVASKVEVVMTNRMFQSLIFTLVAFSILYSLRKPEPVWSTQRFKYYLMCYSPKFTWVFLLVKPVIAVLLLAILPSFIFGVAKTADIPLNYWKMHATYSHKGLPLSFTSFYLDSIIEPPSGYSPSLVSQKLEEYQPQKDEGNIKPNIVIIQNESQADFSKLEGLQVEPDPLAFQHSLTENAVHGSLNVSVYGGGTANTEYETLTSNALVLLSQNVFPYQQLITQPKPNFTTFVEELGYKTVALHPQAAKNYNREEVYRLLGFDQAYFLNSKPAISQLADIQYDRGFPTDQFLFNAIENLYQNKDDSPLFTFAVSMQSHGGYGSSEENYTREVTIDGSTSTFPVETEFLTSVKKSDQAFANLVEFFKAYPEPTIIVMYGDHQPALSETFYQRFMDLSDKSSLYSTPFVIWSNFDIPEQKETTISPNFLIPYTLDVLSQTPHALPQSSYYQFLQEVRSAIPVFTTWGYRLPDGSIVDEVTDFPLYRDYQQIEYNNAIDSNPLEKYYK